MSVNVASSEPTPPLSPEIPPLDASQPSVRGRRTKRGQLLRWAWFSLLLILAVLAIRPWDFWPQWFPAKPPPRKHEVLVNSERDIPLPKARPSVSPPLADLLGSVALIEADGPTGREVIGSAFVLAADGQIVSCLHVSSRATKAVARFPNGSVFEIAGYRAVDPQADLALLQLSEPPSSLRPVRLARELPPQLAPVVAWGHPKGIEFSPYDGKFSRLVQTSALPPNLQEFVRRITTTDAEQTWLQHTARLSEGNSGGPLANQQGEVIGINVWVDRQTDYSYALPVAVLSSLEKTRFATLQPLERFATAEVRLRDETWRSTAERLKQLGDEAQSGQWQVNDEDDYKRLQHIAFAVTLANVPDRFTTKNELGERLDALVKEADLVVARLHQKKWNNGSQIIVLNELAAKEVGRPGAGVFFFGSVERLVTGRNQERALLVRLAGFDQMLCVPLEGDLTGPDAGAQCLFVGVNDRGRAVRYGDNPLQPIVAPIIIAPVVVPLGK